MLRHFFQSLLVLCTLLCAASAHADQHGDKTLGIGAGFNSVNHSAYADIYFRYSFNPHVRIAPDVTYMFKHDGASGFGVNVDMQFPFKVCRGMQFFPLAGATFNNWNYEGASSQSRLGANAGAGFDLKFTQTLRLTIIAKYSFMKHTDGVYVGAGIGYNF